jgi:4-oxalmesaconate hydratase
MEMLVRTVGVDNILFASEMLGGVTTVDPTTGRFFDDNRPCMDAIGWLTAADRKKIFEDNARKVYPRLGAILDARSRQIGTI